MFLIEALINVSIIKRSTILVENQTDFYLARMRYHKSNKGTDSRDDILNCTSHRNKNMILNYQI